MVNWSNRPDPMVLERIFREYLAQILSLIATFLDRVLLLGLMVSYLGVTGVADWVIAMAAAGLVSALDFGFTSYYGNRLFILISQGERDQAREVFAQGNLVLVITSLFGGVAIMAYAWLGGMESHSGLTGSEMFAATGFLTASVVIRQMTGQITALYRAHQEFARQTWMIAIADLARVLLLIVLLGRGAGLLDLMIFYLVSAILLNLIWPMIDTRRRFPEYRYRLSRSDVAAFRTAVGSSSQYWAQSVVSNGVSYLPVLLLNSAAAGASVIAVFTLIRTMANYVRTVLTLIVNVFALESGRRIAIADQAGLNQVYRESTNFLATQLGGLAGILAIFAQPLFELWTSASLAFDHGLFWWAMAPLLLFPGLAMGVAILTVINLPTPLMRGRLAQLLITVLAWFGLPIGDDAARMMIALGAGEVLGLAFPAFRASSKLVTNWVLRHSLEMTAKMLASMMICAGLCWLSIQIVPAVTITSLAFHVVVAGSGLLLVLLTLGMSKARRVELASRISGMLAN
jgi:hypothetical protein